MTADEVAQFVIGSIDSDRTLAASNAVIDALHKEGVKPGPSASVILAILLRWSLLVPFDHRPEKLVTKENVCEVAEALVKCVDDVLTEMFNL